MGARANLEEDIAKERKDLEPVCHKYVDSVTDMLLGHDGQPPLMDSCLRAQGNVHMMLEIGRTPFGCIDTCKGPKFEKEPLLCEHDDCLNELPGTRQLERLLGGLTWRDQHAEIKKVCGKFNHELSI